MLSRNHLARLLIRSGAYGMSASMHALSVAKMHSSLAPRKQVTAAYQQSHGRAGTDYTPPNPTLVKPLDATPTKEQPVSQRAVQIFEDVMRDLQEKYGYARCLREHVFVLNL